MPVTASSRDVPAPDFARSGSTASLVTIPTGRKHRVIEACGLRWRAIDTQQAFVEIDELTANRQPTGYQSPRWLADLISAVASDPSTEPKFVAGCRGDDSTCIILPLSVREEFGIRRLEWLGQDISDYNGPVADPQVLRSLTPDCAMEIWRLAAELVGGADLVVARKQSTEFFGHANPFAALASTAESDKAHESFIADLAHPSGLANAKSRRRLREKRKALAKLGKLTIGQAEPGSQKQEAVAGLVAMKSQQLHTSGQSNPFEQDGFLDFLDRATQSGSLSVHGLWLDGRAIAVSLLIDHGAVRHLYQTAYDIEFSKYSPGRILNTALVEQAHDDGCVVFDFGFGDDDYKRSLTNRSHTLTTSIVVTNPRGHLAANIARLSQTLRRTVKQNDWLLSMALSGNRWRRSRFGTRKAG